MRCSLPWSRAASHSTLRPASIMLSRHAIDDWLAVIVLTALSLIFSLGCYHRSEQPAGGRVALVQLGPRMGAVLNTVENMRTCVVIPSKDSYTLLISSTSLIIAFDPDWASLSVCTPLDSCRVAVLTWIECWDICQTGKAVFTPFLLFPLLCKLRCSIILSCCIVGLDGLIMKALRSYLTPTTADGEATQTHSRMPPQETKESQTPKDSRRAKKSPSGLNSASSSDIPPSIQLTSAPGHRQANSYSQPSLLGPYHDVTAKGLLHPSGHQKGSRPTSHSGSTIGDGTTDPSRRSTIRNSAGFPLEEPYSSLGSLVDVKNDMMVKWLYEQQLRKTYNLGQSVLEGVVLKKARGSFTCCPPEMSLITNSLYAMVTQMNVRCAMTINTPVVRAVLASLRRQSTLIDSVPLPEGLRVQIIQSITDLPRSKLHHFAAFVEDIGMLIVWDDEPEKLLQRAETLQDQLMLIIWSSGDQDTVDMPDEKKSPDTDVAEIDPAQLEDALSRDYRPIRLMSAMMVSATLVLCIVCLGLGWRSILLEIMVDADYTRLAFLAALPAQLFISLVSDCNHGNLDCPYSRSSQS